MAWPFCGMRVHGAADGIGGQGDRFQPVPWRDPRFFEVVLDVGEEVAQQRAEDEIGELQDQRDAYVRGEHVELPLNEDMKGVME